MFTNATLTKKRNKILRQVPYTVNPIIPAVSGIVSFAESSNVFKSGIDSDLENVNSNVPGLCSKVTPVCVFEIVKDANLLQMFQSLNCKLKKLCLTQNQIVEFCAQHSGCLAKHGYATFFLLKLHRKYKIACIRVISGLLNLYVLRLENNFKWNAKYVRRLVVPQNYFQ